MASTSKKAASKASHSDVMQEKFVESKEFRMFCLAGLGQGMIYSVMSSYISDFYTNVMFFCSCFWQEFGTPSMTLSWV